MTPLISQKPSPSRAKAKKPSKATSARSKARKDKKSMSRVISIKSLSIVLILLSLAFLGYSLILDFEVRQQFEGKRFSLPAKVYARPLELYHGQTIKHADIIEELALLAYEKVDGIPSLGQYRLKTNRISVHIRPFTYWDGEQPAINADIIFRNNKILKIIDSKSRKNIDLLRFDPAKIGGIYPNSGEDRELVRLESIPKNLLEALLVIEDKRFYQHHGVDPKALVRAATTFFNKARTHGGSTITQQLVKNFFLTPERTLSRKAKEMLMALLLELHYDKNDILETYLNEVYFGQDKNRAIHGVGLAAQFYFGRPITHISTEQGALLVALLKGPAYYNPRRNPDRATVRRNLVISELEKYQFITPKESLRAQNSSLGLRKKPSLGQSAHPAFMELVVKQLKRDYKDSDLRSEGLRIFSTLDPIKQKHSEFALKERLNKLENQYSLPSNLLEASLILTDIHSGEIISLIGGRKTEYAGFNRALNAKRPIGSLMKPIIFLSALENSQHYSLLSPLSDTEFTWTDPDTNVEWSPKNFDKKSHGVVPAWLALAKSYNLASAQLGLEIGLDSVMDSAGSLGMPTPKHVFPSALLGSIELSNFDINQSYHSIASGGYFSPLRAIRAVTTLDGIALQRYKLSLNSVVSPETAFLSNFALQQVVKNGTARSLNKQFDTSLGLAAKTGTSDDLRDSWFVGYSGNYLASVWVGNDENKSIRLTGSQAALPIWADVFNLLDLQALQLHKPDSISFVGIDKHGNPQKTCNGSTMIPFVRHDINSPELAPDVAELQGFDCSKQTQKKGLKGWLNRLFK